MDGGNGHIPGWAVKFEEVIDKEPLDTRRTVTPQEFITKWHASELKERSAAQEHFIDLCRLLDEPTPAEADPKGDHYCFEREP